MRNVWWLIKRKTNVYLVVDTSGSMDGEKLTNVQEALAAFISQIEGADERVGLIEFWGGVDVLVPLTRLGDTRAASAALHQRPGGGRRHRLAGRRRVWPTGNYSA